MPAFKGKDNVVEKMCLESDILGPIDYLSDIENFVSFEGAMFEGDSFKYKIKIFLLFMLISPL